MQGQGSNPGPPAYKSYAQSCGPCPASECNFLRRSHGASMGHPLLLFCLAEKGQNTCPKSTLCWCHSQQSCQDPLGAEAENQPPKLLWLAGGCPW